MAREKNQAAGEPDSPCPQCGGYGLIVLADGTVRKCDCGHWESLQLEHALDECGIPKRYRRKGLASFIVPRGDRQRQEIKMAAKAYAETFQPHEDRAILLRGGTGSGKTHVAVGILMEVLNRGHRGLYCNVTALLARLRDSYSANSPKRESEILQEVMDADLLVLDDLGAEAATDWVRDRLYLIINSRYESSRATIVTTNCDDAELAERIGDRSVSRLREMCEVLEFPNEDYRYNQLNP